MDKTDIQYFLQGIGWALIVGAATLVFMVILLIAGTGHL